MTEAKEEFLSAFAFGVESRANLQLKFTRERLEEIKAILSERGVEPNGLEAAPTITKQATIVAE